MTIFNQAAGVEGGGGRTSVRGLVKVTVRSQEKRETDQCKSSGPAHLPHPPADKTGINVKSPLGN